MQGSEELFLVDPLAPSANSAGRSSDPATSDSFPFFEEAVRRAVRARGTRDILNTINDPESE